MTLTTQVNIFCCYTHCQDNYLVLHHQDAAALETLLRREKNSATAMKKNPDAKFKQILLLISEMLLNATEAERGCYWYKTKFCYSVTVV